MQLILFVPQETLISTLKQKHDLNLGFISNQLFELQRNLMKKEKFLSGLIKEREQVMGLQLMNKLSEIIKFLKLIEFPISDNIGTTASY